MHLESTCVKMWIALSVAVKCGNRNCGTNCNW